MSEIPKSLKYPMGEGGSSLIGNLGDNGETGKKTGVGRGKENNGENSGH